MKAQLTEWQNKIDALNQRERALLFMTGLVVIVMFVQTLLIDPLLAGRELMRSHLEEETRKEQQQRNDIQILSAELQAGVNRAEIRRKENLEKELAALDKKLDESLVTMIPPELMSEVLENILAGSSSLKLLSLENKPVEALFQQDAEGGSATSEHNKNEGLYKHTFVLELEGSYMAAIDYFKRLDDLPWRFQWDGMNYQVKQYPNAVITLEVHTVSMSEEWIGV